MPFREGLWKAAKPCELLLEFIESPRWRSPDHPPTAHDLARQDSCLRANHCAVFNLAVIAKPGLPSEGDILSNYNGPRYSRLRSDDGIFPNAYVVSDVNEIVHFRASPDYRLIEGPAIDRGICADFHVILNFDLADLWKFPTLPAIGNVAKAIRSDHGAGMQDHAIREAGTGHV